MVEIIPAVIPQSFKDIEGKAEAVRGLVKTIQIDIMDGIFVPQKSWPYTGDKVHIFEKLIEREQRLPYWEELDFEIDLMVKNSKTAVEKWIQAGATRIIIHFESTKNLEEVLGGHDKPKMCELGLALNIQTPNDEIEPWLSRFNFVQFMGIETIGYQGEPFSLKVIPKIQDLRKKHPEVIISVDGGVNFLSAPLLVKAGANRLVAGSAIWGSDGVKGMIEKLKSF